jgi:hypothetical protein
MNIPFTPGVAKLFSESVPSGEKRGAFHPRGDHPFRTAPKPPGSGPLFRRSGRGARAAALLLLSREVHATIFLPAHLVGVDTLWPLLAVTDSLQPASGNSKLHEVILDGSRAFVT